MHQSNYSVRQRAEHINYLIKAAEKAGIKVYVSTPTMLN